MKIKILHILLLALVLVLFATPATAQITVIGSTGANGTYSQLNLAFTAINGSVQTGNNIVVTITANTTENATATLNAGTWTSLNIYPTVSDLSISGNLAAPLIDLNGADNVIIDGRVNATGSNKDLTILNNSTSSAAGTSTIRYRADASNNMLRYCNIKGSTTDGSGGVIFFSLSTSTGNINNTVDNNNLTNASGNRPKNIIYSYASTNAASNKAITISNNNFYDFFNLAYQSSGILLWANSNNWTISGNSFYETTSFAPTASINYYAIDVDAGGNVYNISINNNYIGGSQPLCEGMWNKTSVIDNGFSAIYINSSIVGGTALANSVQGNTISNFNWNNQFTSAIWNGIYSIGGYVNIGNISGNTIGSITQANSITVSFTGNGGSVNAIYNTGRMLTCNNNTISSISVLNSTSTNASNFYGIRNASSLIAPEIKNNTIGNQNAAYGIACKAKSTGNNQQVFGIYNSTGLSNTNVLNNTIANISNLTESATTGAIYGIYNNNTSGITANNNNIHDLSIANSRATDVVIGICLSSSTAFPNTIIGNTIYNLSNTNTAFTGMVDGIIFNGASTAGNRVSQNYIHDLSVSSSSMAAGLYGIKAQSGTTIYDNNVVVLGGNTPSAIYGIYELGDNSNSNSFFFNTISINGSPLLGASNSSALFSASSTEAKVFKNNIFANFRSNTGTASGKHYAIIYSFVGGSIIADNNDYFVSGAGGMLAYYGTNLNTLSALQAAIANDNQSLAVNPLFTNDGGISPSDYIPTYAKLFGSPRLSVTTDYVGNVRKNYPTMGAFEVPLNYNVELWKAGVIQSSYGRLKDAVDEINAGLYTDDLELKIKGSTIETASTTFNATGSGSASYNSIHIYPTTAGLSITGNLEAPLIDLNGATNVTIDGRVNATGSTKDLTIGNQSVSALAGTSTVRFINDASSNTLKYCTIKGSTLDATGGIVLLSTANATGNNSNTIDNNNITSSSDANRPICAVWSEGTSGLDNSGNTISNNDFYDFMNRGINSTGIYIGANTSTCAVTSNSFYETTSFAPAANVSYSPIYINNPQGTGFNVSGNYIGGQATACGGSTWKKTNASSNMFNGIYLNVGTNDVTNAQNNTIKNISWSNTVSTPWYGIYIAGGQINASGLHINRDN